MRLRATLLGRVQLCTIWRMLCRAACALLVLAVPLASQTRIWSESPEFESYSSPLVYDAARRQVVAFGGPGSAPSNVTQVWDGQRWNRLRPQHWPSARSEAGMVWDSLRQRVVLFGGTEGAIKKNDTWVWDGGDWTELQVAGAPSPRSSFGMCYDENRDRVVVFSGAVAAGSTLELWEFDGTAWSQRNQPTPAPHSSTLSYDAARHVSLAFLGNQMWGWNGQDWAQLSVAGLPYTSGRLLYDPVRAATLLLGIRDASGGTVAQIYEWDGAWHPWRAPTPTAPSRGMDYSVFDAGRDEVLATVLTTESGSPSLATWILDGSGWSRRHGGLPSGRTQAGIAHDPVNHAIVMYGGEAGASAAFDDDTWLLQAGAWSRQNLSPGQSKIWPMMGWDAAHGYVLLWGGTGGNDETWTWNGFQWRMVNGAFLRPPPRLDPCSAYDAGADLFVMFGGHDYLSGLDFSDHWTWNGGGWFQFLFLRPPPPRSAAAMAYDSARHRLVLFGGRNGQGWLDDTWEWDGTGNEWQHRLPATHPAARSGHVMVYHPGLQRTVLFGGEDGSQRFDDTWEWDGNDWTLMPIAPSPTPRSGSAAVYDPDTQEIVLFGGRDAYGVRGDQWRYRQIVEAWSNYGAACTGAAAPLELTADAPAQPGASVQLQLQPAPQAFLSASGVWIGFDRVHWNGWPLPVALDGVGFPGCNLWLAPVALVMAAPIGGEHARARLQIPAMPGLLGLEFFLQGAVYDFTAGRHEVSAGLRGVITTR